MYTASGNLNIDAIARATWNPAVGTALSITYSFLTTASQAWEGDRDGFAAMTLAQQAGARTAMATWSAVANITFTEVASGGQLRLGTNDQGDQSAAYAYYPRPGDWSGLYLNNTAWYNKTFTPGGYGLLTMVHELGHSLGLKHPGDYNAGGGGTPGPYLPAETDNRDYTLMSYYNGASADLTGKYGAAPMVYDVQAIQYLYGANTRWHTGNDVYSFGNAAVPQCIWDAGGTNTFDFSACTGATLIDLNEGAFSATAAGLNNVSIAFGVAVHKAVAGSGGSTIVGNALANTIAGGAGIDDIQGGAGRDSITGGAGNDLLDGGIGADTLAGGAGNDRYTVDDAGDVVVETAGGGNDVVVTTLASHTLALEVDVLRYAGFAGFAGTGNAVANLIEGASDNDLLRGMAGNDTLDGAGGNDTLDGGDGVDTARLDVAFADVTRVRLSATDVAVTNLVTGTVTVLRNIETVLFDGDARSIAEVQGVSDLPDRVTGTAGADTLDGLGGNDTILGLDGADRLDGGSGNDSLDGGAGDDTLVGTGGSDRLAGGTGNDLYVVGVTNIVVTELADGGTDRIETTLASLTLAADVEQLVYTGAARFTGTGNAGANLLRGGAGNDSLNGGAGDDTLAGAGGGDTLDGGTGSDTAWLAGARASWQLARPNATDLVATQAGGSVAVTLRNVEFIAFDGETVAFTDLAAGLVSPGDDSLPGTAGNDSIDGRAGNDTMAGGAGDDSYAISATGDIVVEAQDGGTDTVRVAIAKAGTVYVLAEHVENGIVTGTAALGLTGNAAANSLTGNAAANTLLGLDGADSLQGGAGNDRLDGGSGADTLDGGVGGDVLLGGLGNDVYLVDVPADRITEAPEEGIDSVHTALGSYTLGQNVENLAGTMANRAYRFTGNALDNTIDGNSGNDVLAGGDGNDVLRGLAGRDSLAGGNGDDRLEGGAGNDTLDGGAGTDSALFALALASYTLSRPTVGELKVVDNASGAATVVRNVEVLVFDGEQHALAALQAGLVSPDHDVLTGTPGNDSIDGQAGNDTMTGLDGDDVYTVDAAGDVIVEAPGEGLDTASVTIPTAGFAYTLADDVENGVLRGTAAGKLAGNGGANTLTGNSAANTLEGLAGDDSIVGGAGIDRLLGGDGNDTLAGGAGNDSLEGGGGDDVYVTDASGDKTVEGADGGHDTVRTALASWTLAADIEDLQYLGTGAFAGIGNALDNLVAGGNGADRLNGGAGDDTLAGGLGKDTLTGGLGADSFVLRLDGGLDTVTDFAAGTDHLLLGGFGPGTELVMVATQATGLTTAKAALAIGTAATPYEAGTNIVFVMDDGRATGIYRFVASATDNTVAAGELTQLAQLNGIKLTADDFAFIA